MTRGAARCVMEAAGGGAAPVPAPSREEANNLSAPHHGDGRIGLGLSSESAENPNDIKRVEARRRRYARRLGLRRAYATAPELAELRTVEGYLPRLARCGHQCRTGTVEVRVETTDHGARGYLAGLESCESVWACPVCSARIWARRRDDLDRVAAWAREQGARSWMLTLTVRHRSRHDLRALRAGLALAWSRFISGRFWLNFRKNFGVVGYVRRLEITWGRRHGWHPHLHVQIHARRDFDLGELAALWRARLATRWRECVASVLGDEHVPDLWRGCDLREHDKAHRYIGESSLEITDSDAKQARRRSRLSVGQLADLVASGVRADASRSARERYARAARAWCEYVVATRGARALTWSVGLRRDAGLVDDEDAADAEADAAEAARSPVLATMEGQLWSQRTRWRYREICALLEAAERGDVVALVRAGCHAADASTCEARAG